MTNQELDGFLAGRGWTTTHAARGWFVVSSGDKRIRIWSFLTPATIALRVSIGPAARLPAARALQLNGSLLGGALCLDGDWIDLRATLPLELTDEPRLARTIELLARDAVRVARELQSSPAATDLFAWIV